MIKRFIVLAALFIIMQAVSVKANIMIFNPVTAVFEGVTVKDVNGVDMVPFRTAYELLGAYVIWISNSSVNTAYARTISYNVRVSLNSSKAVVNGKIVTLSAPSQIIDGSMYVPLEFVLETAKPVRTGNLEIGLKLWNTNSFIRNHGWTQIKDGLIAHGGGGILDIPCTNSKESLVRSYWLGHRVYEFDMNTTSDGKLAIVHDWVGYTGIKSSSEWKEIKIADIFETMLLEDLLDLMLEYKDIFIVTDTKSFEYDEDGIREQFSILVNTVKAKSPALLKRIIPQIYDQNCYKLLMEAYPFDSVIYTLYASPDSDDDVVNFVSKHRNIKVVTMAPSRYSDGFAEKLSKASKYIYLFTLNSADEADGYRKKGVQGFYTDFLLPK